jgi:hypothetical protein
MDFNKGRNKMTELETLMLDVTNTLNHNGFDEVKAVPNNTQFSIRVGYWDRIDSSLIETMEQYHSVRITETDWEDEDCGTLYRYLVEVVDEDCGYTIDELNELDSYTEEAMYLESVGISDDAEWGVA